MSDAQVEIELDADDKERMDRLSEEVRARIEEMALIAGRVMNIERGDDSVVRVQLDSEQGTDRFELKLIEQASRTDCPEGTYKDPPGVTKLCDPSVKSVES